MRVLSINAINYSNNCQFGRSRTKDKDGNPKPPMQVQDEFHRSHQMSSNAKARQAGVYVLSPETTFISPSAKIGKGTLIKPGTFIEGEGIEIGEHCIIGPNAYIRDNTKLADYVVIGNSSEVKNSTIGERSTAPHFAFIGDTHIGKGVNIGAGVQFANYNHITKEVNKSIVGDNASIGANSVIVAPVTIGSNAYIAAGSVVTKDIPEGALAVGHSKNLVIKEGYYEKKLAQSNK